MSRDIHLNNSAFERKYPDLFYLILRYLSVLLGGGTNSPLACSLKICYTIPIRKAPQGTPCQNLSYLPDFPVHHHSLTVQPSKKKCLKCPKSQMSPPYQSPNRPHRLNHHRICNCADKRAAGLRRVRLLASNTFIGDFSSFVWYT